MLHGPYTLATPFVYQWKGVTGMKIAPLADVKARFSSYLKESEEGPIIVTRNGKPVAMLLLAYSPKFQRILRAAKQQEIYPR
jgi:antitoxin (DNA-binding transcriptional repressor) of toxin-antitoxin stability system